VKREERFNGRSSWIEFQEAVAEEFQGWEAWVREMEVRVVGKALDKKSMGRMENEGMSAAGRGIGKNLFASTF